MINDPPLEVLPDGPCFKNTVIDLAGVRVRHGRTPYKSGEPCKHLTLIHSESERRVWCEDCNRTIDNYEAFKIFARHFSEMVSKAEYRLAEANAAMSKAARGRAVKTLDRIWSGNVMAVQCPHCKGGLLPEDFADGASASWSREMELAGRRKSSKPTDQK